MVRVCVRVYGHRCGADVFGSGICGHQGDAMKRRGLFILASVAILVTLMLILISAASASAQAVPPKQTSSSMTHIVRITGLDGCTFGICRSHISVRVSPSLTVYGTVARRGLKPGDIVRVRVVNTCGRSILRVVGWQIK